MSDTALKPATDPREVARRIVENPTFGKVVIGAILANALLLGLEAVPAAWERLGGAIDAADRLFVAFFAAEIALRLAAYGRSFFRSPWNLFDAAIVAVSLIPAAGALNVLRALRIVRAFRLVTAVPEMRAVVSALVGALPGIGSIAAVLVLFLYISAVMATNLFGAEFPDRFGSLGPSLFTLFQLMTLDGWSAEIVKPVMDVHPWSILFFLAYILVTTFAVLNLFVAVIVDSMQRLHRAEGEAQEAEDQRKLDAILRELAELRAAVEARGAERPGT
ncbi:MAG TPA: ion transporter [Azospirillaceae bacterium]|nr:ion transporter [Azospirillaceae bacterium]